MSFNPNMSEIRLTNQSPNRNFNPMNSSMQFIPDLNLDNQPDDQISPRKEIIKKGILKTFYYQDVKRRKLIGCNIYVNEMNEQQLQLSKRGMTCRICMNEEETSRFIMPCACKGSLQYIHEECLKLWILQKNGIEDVHLIQICLIQLGFGFIKIDKIANHCIQRQSTLNVNYVHKNFVCVCNYTITLRNLDFGKYQNTKRYVGLFNFSLFLLQLVLLLYYLQNLGYLTQEQMLS